MATQAIAADQLEPSRVKFDRKVHPAATGLFLAVLAAAVVFAGWNILADTANVGEPLAIGAFVFLGVALLIALGFEFVNGFHDTANAVATVIYTHSLPPVAAVVWSGCWNFIGVLLSTGAVAYCDHHPAAGRADPQRRQRGRLRDDLRAADRGGRVEPRHLVARPAQFVEPCADRVDPRRRPRQPIAGGAGTGGTSGVDWGQATECAAGLAGQPDDRLHRRDAAALADEAGASAIRSSTRSRRAISRRRSASAAC